MTAIDSFSIQCVRGIRHRISIDLGGHSLLLHGANGTGKSSIERALRWALAGREEPTDDPPHSSEESYRTHVLAAEDEEHPEVSVLFTDGSSITVRPGEVELDGSAEGFRTACESGLPFLRRAELLDVLGSRPVDRFRYFESFLGLDDADQLIKDLKDLKSGKERRSTELKGRHEAELGALTPLLPEARQDGVDHTEALEQTIIGWLETLGLLEPGSSWDGVGPALASLDQNGSDGLEQRKGELAGLAQKAGALKASVEDFTAYPDEIAEQRRALEDVVADSDQLDLLRHAVEHFDRAEGDTCPVCGETIDWVETQARLAERTERLSEYAQLVEAERRARTEGLELWHRFLPLRAQARELFGDQMVSEATVAAPPGVELLEKEGDRDHGEIITSVGGGSLSSFLAATCDSFVSTATNAAAKLPSSDDLPQLRLASSLVNRFGPKRTALKLLESEFSDLDKELLSLSALYQALRRARQDVARDTLAAIGDRVRDYYFTLHPPGDPEDETGAPAIEVQRHGSGTAFVRGRFAGADVKDPQWVYSDGHLDTVAICIFLALRRYRADTGEEARIMVLDDIVLSIDLGHARRFIDVLKDEFDDHQVLLFTHNGLFAHWCATLIPGLRRIQIKQWSLEEGPHIGDYAQSRERLEESLDDAQSKEIGLHVMWLMDEWLAEARYAYELSVRARPDERYTLTDIWQPFAKVMKKLGKQMDSDFCGAVAALEDLRDLPHIRNSLPAHENEFAKEFPRPTMVDVAQAVLKVVDGLYCSDCRTFSKPIPYRSNPSIMHCKCKRLQYVPAAKT